MTVKGLTELGAALKGAPKFARDRASNAVAVSTYATEGRVSALAPEDTGRLRRAVESSVSGLTGLVTIDDDAWYWRLIEFGYYRGFSGLGGRRYVAARPFVRTAAELETPNFQRRMEDVAHEVATFIERPT